MEQPLLFGGSAEVLILQTRTAIKKEGRLWRPSISKRRSNNYCLAMFVKV